MAGEVKTKVTEGRDPSWSPNGKRIAFTGHDGHDYEIYTISATGGSRFNVTNNTSDDLQPSYSPDGKKIAYVAHRGTGEGSAQKYDSEIYTVNVGGGRRFNVTDNNTGETEPSYSPNGKRIAFSGWDGHDWKIYTINVGGGGRVKVTKGGSPSWGSLP